MTNSPVPSLAIDYGNCAVTLPVTQLPLPLARVGRTGVIGPGTRAFAEHPLMRSREGAHQGTGAPATAATAASAGPEGRRRGAHLTTSGDVIQGSGPDSRARAGQEQLPPGPADLPWGRLRSTCWAR